MHKIVSYECVGQFYSFKPQQAASTQNNSCKLTLQQMQTYTRKWSKIVFFIIS